MPQKKHLVRHLVNKTLYFKPPNRGIVPGRDAAELIFPFRLIDTELIGSPEEESRSTYHRISVVVTGSLVACWNLTDDQRLRVMFEYAKRHVVEKIREGTLGEFEEIDLHTRNVELPCPFDPDRIENPLNQNVRSSELPAFSLLNFIKRLLAVLRFIIPGSLRNADFSFASQAAALFSPRAGSEQEQAA